MKSSACPVAQAAAVVGERWTLLILREALFGVRRFAGFEAELGISPHLLATRLKRLVDEGVLRKDAGGEYRLTEAGRALQPVVATLAAWGANHRAGAEGPGSTLVHTACGCDFEPVLTCSACGEPALDRETQTRFSAALQAERASRHTEGTPE